MTNKNRHRPASARAIQGPIKAGRPAQRRGVTVSLEAGGGRIVPGRTERDYSPSGSSPVGTATSKAFNTIEIRV